MCSSPSNTQSLYQSVTQAVTPLKRKVLMLTHSDVLLTALAPESRSAVAQHAVPLQVLTTHAVIVTPHRLTRHRLRLALRPRETLVTNTPVTVRPSLQTHVTVRPSLHLQTYMSQSNSRYKHTCSSNSLVTNAHITVKPTLQTHPSQ